MRRLLGLGILVTAAYGCIGVQALASAPVRTQLVVYTPFTINETLASGVKVIHTASGYCWTGSGTSERSDAWRCFIGNEIIDPCYSGPRTWVACPSGAGVIRIKLTKPLPLNMADAPLNTNRADPASITLAHGVTCGFITGATGVVGGLRLNYGCSNRAWLLGSPNRGSPLWSILYLRSLKASHATSVAILVARW